MINRYHREASYRTAGKYPRQYGNVDVLLTGVLCSASG